MTWDTLRAIWESGAFPQWGLYSHPATV